MQPKDHGGYGCQIDAWKAVEDSWKFRTHLTSMELTQEDPRVFGTQVENAETAEKIKALPIGRQKSSRGDASWSTR